MFLYVIFFACLLHPAITSTRDCSWMERRLNENENQDVQPMQSEDINRIYPYSRQLQNLVNHQIKLELNAFYSYLAMSHFFAREDHDLPGFSEHFHKAAFEELKHAEMFMSYQAKRGGRVKYFDLPAPLKQTFTNGQHAFKTALSLERNVTDEVLCLHQLATDRYNDVDLINFLEGEIIPEQYESMKEISTQIKTLTRMASSRISGDQKNYGIAEFHFDQKLRH